MCSVTSSHLNFTLCVTAALFGPARNRVNLKHKPIVLFSLKLGEVATNIPTPSINVDGDRGKEEPKFHRVVVPQEARTRSALCDVLTTRGTKTFTHVVDACGRDRVEDAQAHLDKELHEDETAVLLVFRQRTKHTPLPSSLPSPSPSAMTAAVFEYGVQSR